MKLAKHILISFLLTIFMMSCATVQSNRYAYVTVESMEDNNCEPVESWRVGVLGVPAMVFRFDDCLAIKMLLVISIPDLHTKEIREASVNLLALHYIEYLKQDGENSNVEWSIKNIKKEPLDKEDGTLHFFIINNKKKECNSKNCKIKVE